MKHEIERLRSKTNPIDNYYISNGEFIVAMIYCGYKWKRCGAPNCQFRYSKI
jgi:hypothetical protein